MQLKRQHFYPLERIYTALIVRLLPVIAALRVTPNQVTLLNLANGLLILLLIGTDRPAVASVLIQVYLMLDILDGNLARYRQLSSRLGAVLDNLGDRFFYNAVAVVIGLYAGNHPLWIVHFLIMHNLHAGVATYYIVPRIRKCESFRRFKIKSWLMDRGIIAGMDLSTQDLIMSVLLLTPWAYLIVPIIGLLYGIDLILRLIEVGRNG